MAVFLAIVQSLSLIGQKNALILGSCRSFNHLQPE